MDALDFSNALYGVSERRPTSEFPATSSALRDPDGLLAIGGDLTTARLRKAYARGIFPWYSDGQPILWWSPDPRTILLPRELHISRSLAKTVRQGAFEISWDRAFPAVISACAEPRGELAGTWITDPMRDAYIALHEVGVAHSMECWAAGELCGGIYGIALGRVFFGESMFSRRRDASKVAMVALCAQLDAWGYRLIDCQVDNPHLASLGAKSVSRDEFEAELARWVEVAPNDGAWSPHGHAV